MSTRAILLLLSATPALATGCSLAGWFGGKSAPARRAPVSDIAPLSDVQFSQYADRIAVALQGLVDSNRFPAPLPIVPPVVEPGPQDPAVARAFARRLTAALVDRTEGRVRFDWRAARRDPGGGARKDSRTSGQPPHAGGDPAARGGATDEWATGGATDLARAEGGTTDTARAAGGGTTDDAPVAGGGTTGAGAQVLRSRVRFGPDELVPDHGVITFEVFARPAGQSLVSETTRFFIAAPAPPARPRTAPRRP